MKLRLKKIDTDIDIDVADRDFILKHLPHVSALAKDNEAKHNVGVYFQNIPRNPLNGYASINFEDAQDLGYFKIDILNNHIYENVKDEEHLNKLVNQEPIWSLLEYDEIIEQMVHIHSYANIVKRMKPTTVEQLAMVLAMIRPAKKHLVGKDWDTIKETIWNKPKDGSYHFKKSHSIAYSISIVVQLNLLVEQLLKDE